MSAFQFWKSWPVVYQRIFFFFGAIFLAAAGFCLIALFNNPAPFFTWQQLQELQQPLVPVHHFEIGGNDFTVFANNHIVFERWAVNKIMLNVQILDLYLFFFTVSLAMLISVITVLKRFWFFVGSGMIIFLLTSIQWEAMAPGGLENKLPAGIIVLVVIGLCLFYQYLRMTASFLERLLVFSGTLLIIGILVSNFSPLTHPWRLLAVNTLPAAFVLFAFFIIMVAHEIIAGFISLVSQGSRNSKNLKNFLIISVAYLLNLWLAYWNRITWLDWDFTIHPIVILCLSAVLAIWGIRQRQPQYENIVAADPFAVYFILSFGALTLSVVGYFLASANDIAILSIKDLILYTHIGYGMIFLVYVISNFLDLLRKNMPAHRVLYKPTAMPYFTYRFAGLIFTLAFLFYNTWMVPFNHFTSAYYTAVGDFYAIEGDAILAMGYYRRAHVAALYNQHAATVLAEMEREIGNASKEGDYLHDANQFLPTEFTLMNAGNAIHRSGKTVDEIIFLQEARKILPASSVISNNLALAFARLGVNDSASVYFSKARKDNSLEATADMNQLGLLAKSNYALNLDSLIQLTGVPGDRVKSNAIAIANQLGKAIDITLDWPKDSALNLFSASLIGNLLINHLEKTDTAFLSRALSLARKKGNEGFKEIIFSSAAHACYATGQVNRAFQLMQELILEGTNPGKYNTVVALWALDQGMPEAALSSLQQDANRQSPQSELAHAVALGEAGKINEAIIAWDILARKDSSIQSVAESMKRILGGPETWYGGFTDKEKYQFLRYRIPLDDSIRFKKMILQIANEDLRARAILDRSMAWYALDRIDYAAQYFKKLQGLHLNEMKVFADIKYFELRLFAARGQYSLIQEQIQKGILFGPYREEVHVYSEALSQAATGDLAKAETNFRWLAYANSWFDDGIVAAALFFQKNTIGKYSPYAILSEALQVNGKSIKILKAYIPAAKAQGFDQYAVSAIQTLQSLIPDADFRKYVNENQLGDLLLP